MIVLLVAHHVNHLVDRVIFKAEGGRSDVLGHVNACSVSSEQQLLVESLVAKVGPDTAIGLAEEQPFGQSFFHFGLAFEVGFRLIIYLVETYTHSFVGLVEAFVHPIVHLPPQRTHLFVALFPAHEHVVCLFHQWRFFFSALLCLFVGHTFGLQFGRQFCQLGTIMLVEGHVIVANEVVAFLSRAFGSGPIAPLLPCQHRLTDMYSAVVDDVCLYHTVAVGFHNLGERPSQEVVSHMSEVQRLVGIGRRILHHHQWRLLMGGL